MSDGSKSWPTIELNENDPRLKPLLSQIEGLVMEHRGQFTPRLVHLHPWDDPTLLHHGVLVNDDGAGHLTVAVAWALCEGDRVMLHPERVLPGRRGELFQVVDSRHGVRKEDAVHPELFVTYLRRMER